MNPETQTALSTISPWLLKSIFNVICICIMSIQKHYTVNDIIAIDLFLNELNVFFDPTVYNIYIYEGIFLVIADLKNFYGVEEKDAVIILQYYANHVAEIQKKSRLHISEQMAVYVLHEDDCITNEERRCKENIVKHCTTSFFFGGNNIWNIGVGDCANDDDSLYVGDCATDDDSLDVGDCANDDSLYVGVVIANFLLNDP